MRQLLLTALILGAFAVPSAAQGNLPSIFLFPSFQGGKAAEGAASSLENQLYTDLFNKYKCIDMMDRSNVEALIEYQRMKDLLGGEPNEQLLSQLGGAIGARYVINVSVTQLPNGTFYMRVVVIDSATAKPISMRDAPPVSEAGANAVIDSLRAQILADMASRLDGKCDEHWTGSITFNYKYEKNETRTSSGIASIADYANARTTSENDEKASDQITVTLQPMSLGMNGSLRPRARITRSFDYHRIVKYETKMQVRCRPRGGNSYLRNTVDKRSETMYESGSANAVTGVYIYIFEDGRYQVRIDKLPEVVTKWTRDDNEQRPGGCEDPPAVISSSSGENSVWAGSYKHAGADIEGRVDPKHPDDLSGTLTLGNESSGIQVVTWNLKRVRPKARGGR
jgi:hypothetical protein